MKRLFCLVTLFLVAPVRAETVDEQIVALQQAVAELKAGAVCPCPRQKCPCPFNAEVCSSGECLASRDVLDRYEWQPTANGQLALLRRGKQVGNWIVGDGYYPLLSAGVWGARTVPPIPVPVSRPADTLPPTGHAVQFGPARGFAPANCGPRG